MNLHGKNFKKSRVYSKFFLIFLLFFILFNIPSKNYYEINSTLNEYKPLNENIRHPKTSSLVGFINLTNNFQINNKTFWHNDTIPIKGRIYNIQPPNNGFANLNVSIVVNGNLNNKFNDTTDGNGDFQINFTIPNSLNVHSIHQIQVNITDDTGALDFAHLNKFYIQVNGTSFFDVDLGLSDDPNTPLIPGEVFHLEGHLRYNNGSGIASQTIYRYWTNSTSEWLNGSAPTGSGSTAGEFTYNLTIPAFASENITLKLNQTDIINRTKGSEILIPLKLFKNITCNWNIVGEASVGDQVTVQGRVVSRTNNSMGISGRYIQIFYGVTPLPIQTTDSNGNFSYSYTLPFGTGVFNFRVELITSLPIIVNSSTSHYIIISAAAASPPPVTPPTAPPFLNFIIIFIPIVVGIIGALAIYGIRRLRKQDTESRSVKLPLEFKIRNMKILKDTGRLEEALSYLFNAIYMDLVDARFGRKREVNETIRDFAIVSVKELNLNPAAIYPFITKVEEMIYARPFTISEKDFYDTVGLFSPIYNQITGSYFKLNF